MYGQMTAESWISIGNQGILQGSFQTFVAIADLRFRGTLAGMITLTVGLGGMGGAQPLAVTMNGGMALCCDVDPDWINRRVGQGYLDEYAASLDQAVAMAAEVRSARRPLSIGVEGNAAEVFPALLVQGVEIDIVTDQTSAHDPLNGYVPEGLSLDDAVRLRDADRDGYIDRVRVSMARQCEAMVGFQDAGAEVFDDGNNLRGEARLGGVVDAFY